MAVLGEPIPRSIGTWEDATLIADVYGDDLLRTVLRCRADGAGVVG